MPDKLAASLSQLVARVPGDGPGIAVGVYRDGRLLACASAGLASIEHGVPITDRTVFDLGSVSKQMTAAVILLLARDGLLDLDDDLHDLVPELAVPPRITLRQVLTHTSGLRDYTTMAEIAGVSLALIDTESAFVRYLCRTGLNFPPGTAISNSSTGYVVAGLAVRRATGHTVADLLRRLVFEPLGMTSTRMRDEIGMVVPDLAFSYRPRDGGGHVRVEMPEALLGDKAVLTSIRDLAPWHGFLTDGRVLGTDIRAQLLRRATLADGRPLPYSLGLFHTEVAGRIVFMHRGGVWGYRTFLIADPDSGCGVTVLGNGVDKPVRELAWAAMGLLGVQPGPLTTIATAPRDVTGLWFAPELTECIEVRNGESARITVRLGAASMIFAAVDIDRWVHVHPHGSPIIEAVDERLVWQDHMGRRIRYVRVRRGGEPDASHLVGRYRSRELFGDVVVERDLDRLLYRCGRHEPRPLAHACTYAGDPVYHAGGTWLRFHNSNGDRRVTLSASHTHVRGIPAVHGGDPC